MSGARGYYIFVKRYPKQYVGFPELQFWYHVVKEPFYLDTTTLNPIFHKNFQDTGLEL